MFKTGSKKDSKSKSKGETDAKEDLEEAGGETDSARGMFFVKVLELAVLVRHPKRWRCR